VNYLEGQNDTFAFTNISGGQVPPSPPAIAPLQITMYLSVIEEHTRQH